MKRNRKVSLIVIILLATIIAATMPLPTVQAEPRTIVTRGSYRGKWFTTIHVVLGDANNTIRIPDAWNGNLVVLCQGYNHELDPNSIPMDLLSKECIFWMYSATAASNYGKGGYCVKEAMIRTHQLTEYVIDNFGVTGKVLLCGVSLGGSIALQLGAKYPDLYDGVLDICGGKNLITNYNDKNDFANIPDNIALQTAIFVRYGITMPLPAINGFRAFCLQATTDIALACGGTPEVKPKAYERMSPTFSAVDITVPTITVHGTNDPVVHYSQSVEFMNAVEAAGHSDMYRLYKVVGSGHGDLPLYNQAIGVCFPRLWDWVVNGTLPPASDS